MPQLDAAEPSASVLTPNSTVGQSSAGGPEAALAATFDTNPRDLETACELVNLMVEQSREADALEVAKKAMRHSPGQPMSHYLLGLTLQRCGRTFMAAWHLERALVLSGTREPKVLLELASCRKNVGDMPAARALLNEVCEALPDCAGAIYALAVLEERDRNFEAAAAVLERLGGMPVSETLQRSVDELRADLLIRTGHLDGALGVLEGIDGCDPVSVRAGLARGRTLDRLGRHAEAFNAWEDAKRRLVEATGHRYDAEGARDFAAAIRGFFTGANMALLARADLRADVAQPLFVVGSPRSGTTLMEQSVACHSAIKAGGEVPYLVDLAQGSAGLLDSPLPYPNALAELWMAPHRSDVNLMRDFYLTRLADDGLMTPGARWVVDKNNDNELHLGLIALVFPRSPVIRMLRHPLDVLLSVMSQPMDYGFHWGISLETAARHYALVADLADDMMSRFEHRCLVVHYENLVDSQEETMRRVFEHIGEDFDPACLDFHENRRYAVTESHAQVSQPLYDRARGRYRSYLPQLAPVLPILRPVLDRWGYEV